MKKIAISQSNYLPWKGYFDLIEKVDEFVIYDDMQYTRRDWRNRNQIKTDKGLHWLTVPVAVKGKYYQKINETKITDHQWQLVHWKTIKQFYGKALFFDRYYHYFEDFYNNNKLDSLSEINIALIKIIINILGIKTKISKSSDYELIGDRTEKILNICTQSGSNMYISGPSAKDYFDLSKAEEMGIKVEWMNYADYPQYSQLYPPFVHNVSVVDLIFNEGPDAYKFFRSI